METNNPYQSSQNAGIEQIETKKLSENVEVKDFHEKDKVELQSIGYATFRFTVTLK